MVTSGFLCMKTTGRMGSRGCVPSVAIPSRYMFINPRRRSLHSPSENASLSSSPLLRQPEGAIEVVTLLPSLQQAFGFEPFEVGRVQQGGQTERPQGISASSPIRRTARRAGGPRFAPSIGPWRLSEAMTSRLISRPESHEISPASPASK